MNVLPAILMMLLLSGCPARPDREETVVAADFANRVWQTEPTSTVAAGALYVFLGDGALLIASSTGPPSLGRWEFDASGIILIEESIPYRAEIVALEGDRFSLIVRGPGEPVRLDFRDAGGGAQ